jgi:hypothetical protein
MTTAIAKIKPATKSKGKKKYQKTEEQKRADFQRRQDRANEARAFAKAIEEQKTDEFTRKYGELSTFNLLKKRVAEAQGHEYSFRNLFTLWVECPSASELHTFGGWLAKGYAVRKGEKGIELCAPRDGAQSDGGKSDTVAYGDDTAIMQYSYEQYEGRTTSGKFHYIHVFNISQVDSIVDSSATNAPEQTYIAAAASERSLMII